MKNGVDVEIDSHFDEIGDITGHQIDSLRIEANGQFPNTESKADNIESEMKDVENSGHSAKRKAKKRAARKSMQVPEFSSHRHVWPFIGNLLVIPDSGTESGSDSESENKLAWKKPKIDHSLVGCQGERVIAFKEIDHI